MNINEEIAYFLRDAQYYLAELQTKKNALMRNETQTAKKYDMLRWEVNAMINVLYDRNHEVYGTYAGFWSTWTESSIILEIEYLRNKTGMSNAPWFEFGGISSYILNNTYPQGAGGSANINESTPNYVATYKDSKTLSGKPLSQYVGMLTDNIEDYFNGVVSSSILEIPFILNPAFTASEWSDLNPLLKTGQIGYLIDDNGLAIDFKVGPGYWNDLSYLSSGVYTYDMTVDNEIGDAKGNLNGKTIGEVLNLMLNPYQTPEISGLKVNADGAYKEETTIEIGLFISGEVYVQWAISNTDNLAESNPINITAGDIFSNEGDFANSSPATLTLDSDYAPTLPTTVEFQIKATHTNGVTVASKAYLIFSPRVIWGVSQLTSIVAVDLNNGSGLQDRQYKLSSDYKHDYTFNQPGYLYIAIPTMLSPSDMSFADITDKQMILSIEMEDLGSISSVNNGVGTYDYQIFRSKYKINESKTIISVE